MHSSKTATIASGVLTVVCFIAAVRYHMSQSKQRKQRKEAGEETMMPSEKSKKRLKYVFAVSTVLFGALFIYQLMHKHSASSSYIPSSSMQKYQHNDDFTRRVNEATTRLRSKLKGGSSLTPSSSYVPPISSHMPSHHGGGSESSRLAARASAEISSFIANNL